MFWKNANSLSLVTKLMLFYSLSTIGLLGAIGVFLYPTYVKLMEKVHGSEASFISAECYEKIIITLLVGSLLAVLFGYVIARNGLNRMREFEHKMEQITADSLHERICLNDWPKELKSFGKKFNTMLDRIQTSFIQLSQFSSDIAHELRTPINNLRGITEIALTNDKYSDDYRQLLEKYMNEYQHLSKLIENLLFLARSDHGQLTLKKTVIAAKTEIANICDYYQALADENQIELICIGDANIWVDLTLFKRVMSNLLSNALKYTLPNGKVIINITTAKQGTTITIQDTGVGIAESHHSRIFDRFYRVDAARSMHSGGLGLGLALVKSIVDLHQGTIALMSQITIGTTVTVQFPHSS